MSLPMAVRTLVQHNLVMNHQQKEDGAFLLKLINRWPELSSKISLSFLCLALESHNIQR